MDHNDENSGIIELSQSEMAERFDADSFWKDLIERFFYPMLERAIPSLFIEADSNKTPKFLDKEFRDILNSPNPKLRTNAHYADYLISVPLKNGKDTWVLLHIEIQGQGNKDLTERMHHYYSLVYGHYRKPLVALAIITEPRKAGEKRFYEVDLYGTHICYTYNNLVLSELDEKELLSGDNPFDLVLCAAKAAVKNKKKEQQKYHYLRSLLGHLSKRGWSTQDKRDLMLFIERIINLKDEALAEKIVEYQRELEEEAKIVYVSLAEREGIKKGKLEGKLEGKREGKLEGKLEAAKNFLAMGLPVDKVAKGTGLSEEEVRALQNS